MQYLKQFKNIILIQYCTQKLKFYFDISKTRALPTVNLLVFKLNL